MKKRMTVIAGLISVLTLAGCLPEQKVVWSPDGKQAAVVSDGSLYLCDPDGALSDKFRDDVVRIAWRNDSNGLVLIRTEKVSSWEGVEKLLSPEEARELADLGDSLHATHMQKPDIDAAMDEVLAKKLVSENQMLIVGLYLLHRYPEMAAGELGLEVPVDPVEMQVVQLGTLDDRGLQLGKVLCGASDSVWDLRISPADDAVAYSSGGVFENDSTPASLYVASLGDTTKCHRIASGTALFPDWSMDGRYLIYAVASGAGGDDDLQLGALARRQVADENGLLKELPDQEELVGLLMSPLVRVRCLPDGSMVFTAFELTLPTVAGDMPEYMNFFRFDPARQSTVERMFPRSIESCLGERSMLFEPSPDGRKIAFLDAEGRAAIITLATGKLESVPDSDSEDVLPSWRGNDEIYCACSVKAEESGESRSYVARCPVDGEYKPVDFSASWSEEVLKGLKD